MAHRPIVEWARANGIPDDFADDAEITVDEAAGVIMVEMFARDPGGDMLINGSQIMTELRQYPLVVPPPAGLIDMYERLRQRLQAERSAVASIRRDHLNEIIDSLRQHGFLDAAQHLMYTRACAAPKPTHRLMPFRGLIAILGEPAIHSNHVVFAPGCRFTVRDNAPVTVVDGHHSRVVGQIAYHEVEDGRLYANVEVLPGIHAQLESGEKRLSMTATFPLPEAVGNQPGPLKPVAEAQIDDAVVADPASWPWKTPYTPTGEPNVQPQETPHPGA